MVLQKFLGSLFITHIEGGREMLTCKNINAETAKSYFEKGFYGEGRWFGKAAVRLQLTGNIEDFTPYRNLLDGLSPFRNKRLTGRSLDSFQHRAALDCIFNAPKSVSLQALIAGDDRVVRAHRNAVDKTLRVLEDRYAHTRTAVGLPRQTVVKSGKLAIALFDHIENRVLDPHLHTHCVVMNFTLRNDGKWRALHNDAIYRHQKLLGLTYQHHLALELGAIGYEVIPKGRRQFEIAGIDREHIRHFSKRREAIVARTGENAGIKERIDAWEYTRPYKKIVPAHELKAKWKEEAAGLGIEFPFSEIEPVKYPVPPLPLDEAIEHCSDGGVAFFGEELENYILSRLPVPIDPGVISKSISNHPELVKMGDQVQSLYTTQKAIVGELTNISLMTQLKGKNNPLINPESVSQSAFPDSMGNGQREAIVTALTTTDRVMGIASPSNFRPGMLGIIAPIASVAGYRVRALTPDVETASLLKDELGIETRTFDDLFPSQSPLEIWAIDRAEMLTVSKLRELLELSATSGVRLILMGDTKSKAKRISSAAGLLERGNALRSLEKGGMTTVFTDKYIRPMDRNLGIALDLLRGGDDYGAIDKFKHTGSLVETEDAVGAAVSDYLSLPPQEREDTAILVSTKEEKGRAIENLTRGLAAESGSEVFILNALSKIPAHLTHSRETLHGLDDLAYFINEGDWIVPTRNRDRRNLKGGHFYRVVDKGDNSLTLDDGEGNRVTVDPRFGKTGYRNREIPITIGSRLRWTKGKYRGKSFVVRSVNGDRVSIEYPDGKRSYISLKRTVGVDDDRVRAAPYTDKFEPRPFSGGQLSSLKRSRLLVTGDSIKDLLLVAGAVRKNFRLYTSDRDKLAETVSKSRNKKNPYVSIKRTTSVVRSIPVVETPTVSGISPREVEVVGTQPIGGEAYGDRTTPVKEAVMPGVSPVSTESPPYESSYGSVIETERDVGIEIEREEAPDINITIPAPEVVPMEPELEGRAIVEKLFPLLGKYWDAGGEEVGSYDLDYDDELMLFTCRNRTNPQEYLCAGTDGGWRYEGGWLSRESAEYLEETCIQLLSEIESELDEVDDVRSL